MSKPELEALKARFKEQKESKKDTGTRNGDGDYYTFWQIQADEISVVRMLPVLKSKTAMPFLEKDHHKISIDGKDETIPCIGMYGETCPICELSKKYYAMARAEKNPELKQELEVKGKYYYRSRSYLASAYIKKDPLPKNAETGENAEGKVKVIQFGNQLFKKFDTSLDTLITTGELDEVPWHLENGLDFNIVKKMGQKWAEWDLASDFARRSSSLPADFVESFSPVDLTKYLPANPGLEKVQRMLDAHQTNSSYSDDSSSVAKETPVRQETPVTQETTSVTTTTVEAAKVEAVVEVKKEAVAADDNQDEIAKILAQLKLSRESA